MKKISLNPLFLGYLAFLVAIDSTAYMLIIILSSFIHEYAHIIVMKKKGLKIKNLNFSPLGMRITPTRPISYKDEVTVAAAGPIINIFVFSVLYILSFAVKLPYFLSKTAVCNFILGFGNLIPLLPLDGGRILRGILYMYAPKVRNKVLIITGVFCSLLFWCLGAVVLIKTGYNISVLLIGIYLSAGFAVAYKKEVENV